jgi:hypothetical protein
MHIPRILKHLARFAKHGVRRGGVRTWVSMLIASCLLTEAGAVITQLGPLVEGQHQIRISVGAENGVDTVNFEHVTGAKLGTGEIVNSRDAAGVDLQVWAWTPGEADRMVTVTANSTGGLVCITSQSCGLIAIPFDTVSWTVGRNAVAGNGIVAGRFNGSAAQPLAHFASAQRLQSTLNFRYANNTFYPAGTYVGRVTFTASMP